MSPVVAVSAGALWFWGFPLGVSLVPIVAGHAIRGRGLRAQLLVTAIFAALGAGLAAHLFDGRANGVPESQALEGAVLTAGLLVLLPTALYVQLGYRVRLLALAVGVWFASLIPFAVYLLFVGVKAWERFACVPGESCSLFG